jgi:hypothetical protein
MRVWIGFGMDSWAVSGADGLDAFECGDKPGGALVEFGCVVVGEIIKDAAAGRRELQQDAAAVGGVMDAGEQASLFAALGELDDAVMARASEASECSF